MITKGEMVLYTLSAADAEQINRRRTDGASIAARMKMRVRGEHEAHEEQIKSQAAIYGWPAGAQAHIGNSAKEGAQYPAMVVEDWSQHTEASGAGTPDDPAVNLQVFLDGTDVFWATSRHEDASKSPAPGTWQRRA
jgi:hypothetical protein